MDSFTERTEPIVSHFINTTINEYRSVFHEKGLIESPIEDLLLLSLIFRMNSMAGWPEIIVLPPLPIDEFIKGEMDQNTIYVMMQVDYHNLYRVDFMGIMKSNYLVNGKFRDIIMYLAIECDGHDFHEKTKAQVAKDNSRDRYFLQNGIPTMRFSGSEIWRDPVKCVDEIIEHFSHQYWREVRTLEKAEV